MSRLKLPYQAFRSVYVCQSATQPFLVSPRNATPHWAIRGLTRFLTMAEIAEVEGGVVIIDCVAVSWKRAKEANIIATRISIDVGFRELKFGKFASYRRGV